MEKKKMLSEDEINQINLKVDDLCTQLKHHSEYFYDKSIVLGGELECDDKLINEYFTYHKVMSNFIQEVKEINKLVSK